MKNYQTASRADINWLVKFKLLRMIYIKKVDGIVIVSLQLKKERSWFGKI